MAAGRVAQAGPIDEVFARPASVAVAGIVGVDNIFEVEVTAGGDGLAEVQAGPVRFLARTADHAPGRAHVAVRGEDIVLAGRPGRGMPGVVGELAREGPLLRVRVSCGIELTALVSRQSAALLGLERGSEVRVVLPPEAVHLIR
jgi:ABC-type sulfate/molybdate transport systems ATPase subunit